MRLLAHNDGRELRGNERQLLLLARGLAARGHDVLVSCRGGAPLAQALGREGVAVTTTRPRGDLALPSAVAFRRLVGARAPNAVLLTSWKRLLAGTWAARRGAPAARVVVRLGIVRRIPERGRLAWKLRRALDRADLLVVNSDAVRRAWIESAPWFPPERLVLVRNAVEAHRPGDPAALRHELGLGADAPLLVTVAALEPRKGIDVLLHALAALPAEVHAAVAGDGPEAGRLGGLARALGVDRRVHWLGARADVGDVLAGASVFVLPSRRDSTPNALLEAMAAGLPVIATGGIGAEEALGVEDARPSAGRPGDCPAGWVVPPEDPPALAAAIGEALAPLPDRTHRALEARRRAEHWFGVPRMVDAYERVLFGSTPVGA